MPDLSTCLRVLAAWLLTLTLAALLFIAGGAGWVCSNYWNQQALSGLAQAVLAVTVAVTIAPRNVTVAALPPILLMAGVWPVHEALGRLDRWSTPRWYGYWHCFMPAATILISGLLLTCLLARFPTPRARATTILTGFVVTGAIWAAYGIFIYKPAG